MNITTPATLTHYLTTEPLTAAKQLDRKALLWDIAAKTTLVALFIISAAVLTVTLAGSEIFCPALLYVTFGLTLSTPVIFKMERYFAGLSQSAHLQATIEHGVDFQLKQIKEWSRDNIATFYQHHYLNIPQLNEDVSLLSLIARYLYWNQQFNDAFAQSQKNLNENVEGNYLKDQKNRDLRYITRQYGWDLLENNAIPARLESAVILQLLKDPYHEVELSTIGHHEPITFSQWLSEAYLENQDVCFKFANEDKPSLSSHQITDVTSDVRKLVFGS